MLKDLKTDSVLQPMAYGTASQLFDAFWERKLDKSKLLGVSAAEFQKTIDLLCEVLESRGSLFAPKLMLDTVRDAADKLASEHVFSFANNQWSFSHEGFYDFANARRLLRAGIGVADYLKNKGQGLELRTQLRQSLAYRRMADFVRYLKDLELSLSDPAVRFHLKATAVAFLKDLSDPNKDESDLVSRLIEESQEKHLNNALLNLIGWTPTWFQLSVDSGTLTKWLGLKEPEFLDRMTFVLTAAARHNPDCAATLLGNVWNSDEEWRKRTPRILSYGRLEESRNMFLLFLDALQQGLFDPQESTRGQTVWSFLHDVSEKHPEWTCEAISVILRRMWHAPRNHGDHNPFKANTFDDTDGGDETIRNAFQNAPLIFLREVWPTFIEIVRSNLEADGDPPFRDNIWSWHQPNSCFRFRDKLINGITVGIRELANTDYHHFGGYVLSVQSLNSETVENIILNGFACAAQDHGDNAISYLLERATRFRTGWGIDPEGPARELIQKASRTCGEQSLRTLEEKLLNHYTEWEKDATAHAGGSRSFGRSQNALLSGVEPSRRSAEVTKRLQELERKFSPYVPPDQNTSAGGIVGSPIPDSAARLMTDAQWLSAIGQYSNDDVRVLQDGSTVGGVGCIAIQLGVETKAAPERFGKLILSLPETADSRYFDHILRGISGSSLPVAQVMAACQTADELSDKPCGNSICYCLESFAEKNLESAAIEMVCGYCVSHFNDNTRKSAFSCLANLLFANRARIADAIDCLRNTSESLPRNLRAEFCNCLTPLLRTPFEADAISLFLKIWEQDPWLPTARVEHFLLYAARFAYPSIKHILETLLQSEDPEVRLSAARSVVKAALYDCDARQLMDRIADGDKQHRQGLAQVCAANVVNAAFSDFCEEYLLDLFDDVEPDVRESASECFQYFTEEHLAEYPRLVKRFLESRSVETEANRLLNAMAESTIRHSSDTLAACEKVVQHASSDAEKSNYHDLRFAKKLVLRTYHQAATDSATRERSLDLIDAMLTLQVDGMEDAIRELESRR